MVIGVLIVALVLLVAVGLRVVDGGGKERAHAKSAASSSTSIPTSTVASTTVPPTGAVTSTTVPISPFTSSLSDFVAGRTGTVTAAVDDLNTGNIFLYHPGVVEDEASVVKVDVMATLLAQQPGGGVPTEPSQQQLLASMIEESDNDSATELWDQVGGPAAIASFNRKANMTSTTPSTCVTCANFPWPGWGLSTTTASDQLTLLRQFVVANSLLTAAQRSYGLSLMEQVEPSESWGVSAGVPSGVTIAIKNGWLPLNGEMNWQVNSEGWIDGDGRDYIVSMLTTGNPTEQYGINTIESMSQVLWSQLG
jgi:beta-lactamase class A